MVDDADSETSIDKVYNSYHCTKQSFCGGTVRFLEKYGYMNPYRHLKIYFAKADLSRNNMLHF